MGDSLGYKMREQYTIQDQEGTIMIVEQYVDLEDNRVYWRYKLNDDLVKDRMTTKPKIKILCKKLLKEGKANVAHIRSYNCIIY